MRTKSKLDERRSERGTAPPGLPAHAWVRQLIAAVALSRLLGCDEGERECYPTDWRGCSCESGALGYQQCDSAGETYGVCDCSGMIPGLTTGVGATGGAGAGGGAAGSGGSKKAFLDDCATDEECETGLCHNFMAKGPLCSKPCGADADCPPPSPGCNMMGICKAP